MAGRQDGIENELPPAAKRRYLSGATLAEPKAANIVSALDLVVARWHFGRSYSRLEFEWEFVLS